MPSTSGHERKCARCGTTAQVTRLRNDGDYCGTCDRELHPSHDEASARGDGSYFILVETDKGLDVAHMFLPRTKADDLARDLASKHKGVVMVLGGDARVFHPNVSSWEVHSRWARQVSGTFGHVLDEVDHKGPAPGLRFTQIGSGVDPWKVITCPGCGSRRFESIEGAAVYCMDCGIEFRVRHTAGDPGIVVDAFDRYANRLAQRRRLWVGGVYSVLKTGDDDPHWIVLGSDPRLPHEFPNGDIDKLRIDQAWANWSMGEIGPEYRPIFRTPTPYNIGYSDHRFICGDCAKRFGVYCYNPSDTEYDTRGRHDLYDDPPKIGGNPQCYECGYSQPGFTKHYSTEPLPYKPFGPLRSEEEATRKAKEKANG